MIRLSSGLRQLALSIYRYHKGTACIRGGMVPGAVDTVPFDKHSKPIQIRTP